jgi:hypothetical protein
MCQEALKKTWMELVDLVSTYAGSPPTPVNTIAKQKEFVKYIFEKIILA